MFEKIRKPKKAGQKGIFKSVFAYIIFGAICLVFVFLAPMGAQIFGGGLVAYVGSEPIRSREYRLIEENLRSQYQQRLNEASADESEALQRQIRQSALQQIISLYLISQAAKDSGFVVSDQELQDEISSYPTFQRNGRFIYSNYLGYLKNQRLSAIQFEDRVRRIKMTENWRDVFVKSISSNALERNKSSEKDYYKIKIRFAEIPLSNIEVEKLEVLVVQKKISQLNQFLKKNKIKWETSKEISPVNSFALPMLKGGNLIESIIDHLPNKGLIPKIMLKADKAYVVNVLSFRKTPSNKKNRGSIMSELLGYEKSSRLFENWITSKKEKFPVKQILDPNQDVSY